MFQYVRIDVIFYALNGYTEFDGDVFYETLKKLRSCKTLVKVYGQIVEARA
jgi:hypothetical protein